MTSVPVIALVVIVSVQTPSSSPASADAGAPARTTLKIETAAETPIGTRPFEKVFIQSNDTAAAKEQLRHALEARVIVERTAPKVVCGMTVLPVDPRIDPKMIRRHTDSTRAFHIKRIPPPACTE